MTSRLYTFRRCPFAIRARMALFYAGVETIQIEVDLKNKPQELIAVSPKATVPVLVLENGVVIDESIEIMKWAISQSDPDGWLDSALIKQTEELIQYNDLVFKPILDDYKYHPRAENNELNYYRDKANDYLNQLNTLLIKHQYLLGSHRSFVDVALFPFIRQFAMVDQQWFEQSRYDKIKPWLKALLNSELFLLAMKKSN